MFYIAVIPAASLGLARSRESSDSTSQLSCSSLWCHSFSCHSRLSPLSAKSPQISPPSCLRPSGASAPPAPAHHLSMIYSLSSVVLHLCTSVYIPTVPDAAVRVTVGISMSTTTGSTGSTAARSTTGAPANFPLLGSTATSYLLSRVRVMEEKRCHVLPCRNLYRLSVRPRKSRDRAIAAQ